MRYSSVRRHGWVVARGEVTIGISERSSDVIERGGEVGREVKAATL